MGKPTKNEPPNALDITDTKGIARETTLSCRTVRELTAKGILPVYRIGRRCVRYSRSEVLAALQIFRRA